MVATRDCCPEFRGGPAGLVVCLSSVTVVCAGGADSSADCDGQDSGREDVCSGVIVRVDLEVGGRGRGGSGVGGLRGAGPERRAHSRATVPGQSQTHCPGLGQARGGEGQELERQIPGVVFLTIEIGKVVR